MTEPLILFPTTLLLMALRAVGLYLFLDGSISIHIYRKQRWYEHIPRIIRATIGMWLVIL